MNIIIENDYFKLEVDNEATVKSLWSKKTGEECLKQGENIALFSVTQNRPFNNEVKLTHCCKKTTYRANSLKQEGSSLIMGFETIPYHASVKVDISPVYVTFTLERFIVEPEDYGILTMDLPPVEAFTFLQLPVKDRMNYSEWLVAGFDDRTATCIMATSPEAQVDSEERNGYRIFKASAVHGVSLEGTSAALFTCPSEEFLELIDGFERDFNLPLGVQSRRDKRIKYSEYATGDITPENFEEHLRFIRMGGFKRVKIYYTSMCVEEGEYTHLGDYEWKPEYRNKKQDYADIVNKLKAEGISVGFHFLQTHVGIKSKYVTPRCDSRLNHKMFFSLARPLGADEDSTELYVDQNPKFAPRADRCRLLHYGNEVISYEGFTAEMPYRFTGVKRGALGTVIEEHAAGTFGGILDVSEYLGESIYVDQTTDLPDEIADEIAELYNVGCDFVYMDGSEGTNVPYENYVPICQYRVWKKLNPSPLYCAGAARSHFSWHYMSGGNAFDIFPPEIFKEMIRKWPCAAAERTKKDFTQLNFGWWAIAEGTQADMIEFGASRAAAFDCPASFSGKLAEQQKHPRIADIFEVMRRWEDVKLTGWLSDDQRKELKQLDQEHHLIIDENGEYELVPYNEIKCAQKNLAAFAFARNGKSYVTYWHKSGSGKLFLPLDEKDTVVFRSFGEAAIETEKAEGGIIVPCDNRAYIETSVSQEALVKIFAEKACFAE